MAKIDKNDRMMDFEGEALAAANIPISDTYAIEGRPIAICSGIFVHAGSAGTGTIKVTLKTEAGREYLIYTASLGVGATVRWSGITWSLPYKWSGFGSLKVEITGIDNQSKRYLITVEKL